MDPQVYPGGPLGLREIRLIRLLPGKWTDPIDCELDKTDYDTAEYTALSYVWGSTTAQRPIHFAGQTWEITRNLESALRHIRHHYKEGLTLWVDALCINQMDDSERTHQVGLMGGIYKKCQKVIVYLGDQLGDKELPEEPLPVLNLGQHTPHELEKWQETRARYLESRGKIESHQDHGMFDFFLLHQELSQNIHIDEVSAFSYLKKTDLEEHGKRRVTEEQDSYFRAAERLVYDQNSWWNRTWVIQEVAFTSQIDVIFGPISAPWEVFEEGATSFVMHMTECCSSFDFSEKHDYILRFSLYLGQLKELRSSHNSQRKEDLSNDPSVLKKNTSLLGLLAKFRSRMATDPRDKVYALLSLVQKPIDRPPLVPDYSLSEIEVFRQATLECIHEANSLSVLNTELGRKSRTDLPSWVPDWASPRDWFGVIRAEAVNLYNAYPKPTFSKILVSPGPQNVLSLEGFHFDNVVTIHQCIRHNLSRNTFREWWAALCSVQSQIDSEHKRGLTRAFWKLICADIIATVTPRIVRRMVNSDDTALAIWSCTSHLSPVGHLDFFPDCKQFMEEYSPHLKHTPLGEIVTMVTNTISLTVLGRRLILSEHYFGLAPETTQEGDALFFLRGGRTPFVLRPLGQNKYEIIGECYIQGLMDNGVEKHRLNHDSEMKLVRVELH